MTTVRVRVRLAIIKVRDPQPFRRQACVPLELTSSSAGTALLTGLGDAAGVFMGSIVYDLFFCFVLEGPALGWDSVWDGLLLAAGGFCSGTSWQPIVNLVTAAGVSFSLGMVFVGLVCGSAFLCGILLGAELLGRPGSLRSLRRLGATRSLDSDGSTSSRISSRIRSCISWQDFRTAVYLSATLSVAVAGAAAFFVGTETSYSGNGLRHFVGERGQDSEIVNCSLAGTSTLTCVPLHPLSCSPALLNSPHSHPWQGFHSGAVVDERHGTGGLVVA